MNCLVNFDNERDLNLLNRLGKELNVGRATGLGSGSGYSVSSNRYWVTFHFRIHLLFFTKVELIAILASSIILLKGTLIDQSKQLINQIGGKPKEV